MSVEADLWLLLECDAAAKIHCKKKEKEEELGGISTFLKKLHLWERRHVIERKRQQRRFKGVAPILSLYTTAI